MVAYLTDIFRDMGMTQMQLSVSESNTAALHFYQQNGWQKMAARLDKPDTWLMQKAIGETHV